MQTNIAQLKREMQRNSARTARTTTVIHPEQVPQQFGNHKSYVENNTRYWLFPTEGAAAQFRSDFEDFLK